MTLEKERADKLKGLNIKKALESGDQALKQKAYERAEQFFREALRLDEQNPEARAGLMGALCKAGQSALESGAYSKAAGYFEEALRLDDDNLAARTGLHETQAALKSIAYRKRRPWIIGGVLLSLVITLYLAQVNQLISWSVSVCDTAGHWLCTPTPTRTLTPTLTPLPSPTPSPTLTLTPTPTPTITPTPEPTQTPTNTPPPTYTPTPSPTPCPPPPADWRPYIVQRQDTMFSLARRYGTDVSTILRFNCRTSHTMAVGETLYLPGEPTQPEVIVPELILPYYGLSYKNPVRFEWRGQLQAGQIYRLEVVHADVEKGLVYRIDTQSTTVDPNLPEEKFGELRWTVSVIEAGNEVSRSTQGMFWFAPYMGGPDQSPLPTPTLED